MSPVRLLIAIALLGAALADIPDPVHNTTLWDLVLTQYVTPNQTIEGITLNVVDYMGIANDSNFKAFKDQFAYVDIAALNKSEYYAFLINVYNVFAIDMIITHACRSDIFGNCGALHSIEDIGTWIPHNPVWGMTAGTVGNKSYSLDDIETMLRQPKSFGFTEDSRLHAAIVCASVSCPNVRREAYKPDIIDQQLTENFNDFMSNTGKGMHVEKTTNVVTLSAIFSWFESDFTGSTVVANITDANPIDFILYYLSKNYTDYAWLAQNAHSVTIQHFVYNWRVNAKDGVPCSHKSRPCYTIFALVITLILFAVIVLVFSTIYLLAKRRRKSHRHSKKEYKALSS